MSYGFFISLDCLTVVILILIIAGDINRDSQPGAREGIFEENIIVGFLGLGPVFFSLVCRSSSGQGLGMELRLVRINGYDFLELLTGCFVVFFQGVDASYQKMQPRGHLGMGVAFDDFF